MSNKLINAESVCPCGTGRSFAGCCQPYHQGACASEAESLMRSRYTAFVLGNADYLLRTWDSSTRPSTISFDPQQKWLGLEVLEAKNSDNTAEVEFIARFRIGGASAQRHHERSRFRCNNGKWFYVDGVLRAG